MAPRARAADALESVTAHLRARDAVLGKVIGKIGPCPAFRRRGVGDRGAIGALLRGAGFEESGRYFASEDLGLVVEVPGSSLRPTETTLEVRVDGAPAFVVTPEDALVDRLLAAKVWRSPTDWEQAILLWASVGDRMDPEALRRKAEGNEVEDELERMLREVEGAERS